MLHSVLPLFTCVANVVLFSLLQAVTSSIVTLCPLEAWSTRASSQPSSLPWTCTMRTKPERNPCSFLALFAFFSFLIPIVVYSFHGSPLSEEELLFPEHEPAFSFAQTKTSCGGFWGWHLWGDKELWQARLSNGNCWVTAWGAVSAQPRRCRRGFTVALRVCAELQMRLLHRHLLFPIF